MEILNQLQVLPVKADLSDTAFVARRNVEPIRVSIRVTLIPADQSDLCSGFSFFCISFYWPLQLMVSCCCVSVVTICSLDDFKWRHTMFSVNWWAVYVYILQHDTFFYPHTHMMMSAQLEEDNLLWPIIISVFSCITLIHFHHYRFQLHGSICIIIICFYTQYLAHLVLGVLIDPGCFCSFVFRLWNFTGWLYLIDPFLMFHLVLGNQDEQAKVCFPPVLQTSACVNVDKIMSYAEGEGLKNTFVLR